MHKRLGRLLSAKLKTAKREVVLAAPYIKTEVLNELSNNIRPNVPVKIFTRWHVPDFICGASDHTVFTLVQSKPNWGLSIVSNLHAKYARIDNQSYCGSANLTLRGLGLSRYPNLEIASGIEREQALAFENALLEACVSCSSADYEALLQLIEIANGEQDSSWRRFVSQSEGDPDNRPSFLPEANWIPVTRYPENLWLMYSGQFDRLTTFGREQCQVDLSRIAPPAGLSKQAFYAYIRVAMSASSWAETVNRLVPDQGMRFGLGRRVARDLLRGAGLSRDPTDTWQTLLRWLVHFDPNRYRVSVPGKFSEVLHRAV